MKKNRLMMALALSTGLLFGACGSKETKEAATEAPAPVEEKTVNTTHSYICPMDCENSASNEPGQCVVCGMDLVKNPNYEGNAEASIETTPAEEATATDGHNHDDHEGHNH